MSGKARSAKHVIPVAERVSRVRLLDIVSPSFGFAGGLGTIVEHVAFGLEQREIGTRLPSVMRMDGAPTIGAQILARSQSEEGHSAFGDAVAFFGSPISWVSQRRRRVFGFAGLDSDIAHPMCVANTVAADELWVPSTFAKSVFEDAGARRPIAVVQPGVDPDLFTYRRRERGAKLRILMFATELDDPRKGADIGISAFKAAFPNRNDVELHLWSTHKPSFAEIPTNDARIQRRCKMLPPEQLVTLYHEYDVLLYTSRFESYGLVALEAMATGLPVIMPTSGALEEIAVFAMAVPGRRIKHLSRAKFVAADGGWFESSVDDVVDYLRAIDTDYEAAMDYAAKSAISVASRYSWDNTVEAIADLLSV